MTERDNNKKRKDADYCSVFLDDDYVTPEPKKSKPSESPSKHANEDIQNLVQHLKEPSWMRELSEEFQKPYFKNLVENLKSRRRSEIVYPEEQYTFRAFNECPLKDVRVVILGADPYPNESAIGLAFSVPTGRKINPSLVNIFKEIESDVGQCKDRKDGNLIGWAKQGILLLNTVLTVKIGTPNSHKDIGWEMFTTQVIKIINTKCENVVFILWGKNAKEKMIYISKSKHHIIQGVHPSPMSAKGGFFGSKPFSDCNRFLVQARLPPINWNL
jgi:uracil-DNA glycosylase